MINDTYIPAEVGKSQIYHHRNVRDTKPKNQFV